MYLRGIGRAVVPELLAALGLIMAPGAFAQRDSIVIPADTIVRVKLEDPLSSREARVGDRFEARLDRDDRSGFPKDTRFEGVVTGVQRSSKERPGILDMRFRRAVLPDGRSVAIDGRLASLSGENVKRTSDGRLVSRRRSRGRMDLKWIGYGAAGGAVLSTIFGGSLLKGALLGGLGGAVYSYLNRDRHKGRATYREVELSRGQEFGIRLDRRVAFNGPGRFSYRPGRFDRDGVHPHQ